MASKIDKVLDRLEVLTDDVNVLKRRVVASPIVPLPQKVKAALGTILETSDDLITDTYFGLVRDVADVVLPANVAAEVINNPDIVIDNQGQIVRRGGTPGAKLVTTPSKPRKVTARMKKQRKIQSTAFRNANARGRKKDGTFRSGYDQRRIALLAQKECTAERVKQGLCEKPKRRSKKKK